ncbi:MAG: dipeptidyl-peptidase 4 [Mucilaginibacter sp.]|nr:dipeptidyl-peptidase 4 [Mucilaginibacter sp.]
MKYQLLQICLKGIFALCCILPFGADAQTKQEYGSLAEALRSAGNLSGNPGPQSVNWTNGGNKYSYISNDEIHSMDPLTLKDELIFTNKGLNFPGTDKPFEYESFQWSQDSKHLVFKTNLRPIYRNSGISDYYIYDLESKQLKQAAKDARSSGLSPDGSKVGIERGGNMFVYNFATGKEQQLTNDSTSENGVFNGHYDWVYEEEFGQTQAWNWSPDNKYMAFWQFDERKVPDFQMTNYEGRHPDQVHISIPQVGDPNPSVKIGVVDVTSGKKVWLAPDETGDFYIPRIYWTSNPDVLALMTLNRAQNHMKLYFFNVKTGEHHVVLEEKNTTWVAIFDFYTNVNDMVYFPEKSKEFFWVSDRSGYYHIYRYSYDGKLINQVTKGNWDMIKVTGIDQEGKKIYYLSAETSGRNQELYSIKFDGTNEARLSEVSGYHNVNMSPNTKYFLDSYSNITTPQHVTLSDNKGKILKMLEDNHQVSEFIKTHAYSTQTSFQFTNSDGVRLDGYYIKPFNYNPNKKYPLVMLVYGGPESHEIFDNFGTDMWAQWLAQNGYVVANVNNRGSANYGSAFMKSVYKQLGKLESSDFVETAQYLVKQGIVDPARMAIMGTSYGGYSTTYTLLTHPGVFKVGIANSPVTDWRLYDDVYTERYMAPLNENEAGYKTSSDMTYAGNLKDHLLLIHSMSDDNVHPANTMQLLTALTNAGKDVDLRIYPPGAHGAAYNWESYLLIEDASFQYLERYLKGNNDLPNLNAK